MISEGIHFSLLCLLETSGVKSDPAWLAARLGVSVSAIERALSRLMRLGLVRRAGKKYVATGIEVVTSDNVASRAIKRYHEDRLEEAKERLYSVGVELRDFNAVTIAVSRKQIPAAKRLIRQFKENLKRVLQDGERDEVYRFCIQLYPVTEMSEDQS